MKYLSITIIFLGLLGSCSDEKKCSDFKTGKFRYSDENIPEKITRYDTLQIELNPITGREVHSKVEWTSDCSYTLTYQKVINDTIDRSDLIGDKIYVEILETTKTSLLLRAQSNYMDEEIRMIKL